MLQHYLTFKGVEVGVVMVQHGNSYDPFWCFAVIAYNVYILSDLNGAELMMIAELV